MHWGFTDVVELAGKVIDGFGVAIIVLGALYATEEYLRRQLKRPRDPAVDNYKMYRQTFGRSILMGLEFLVAGDIIRTVAVKPTFTSVGVLARGICRGRKSLRNKKKRAESPQCPWDGTLQSNSCPHLTSLTPAIA